MHEKTYGMAAARINEIQHIRRLAPHSADTEISRRHSSPFLEVETKCLLVVWAVLWVDSAVVKVGLSNGRSS